LAASPNTKLWQGTARRHDLRASAAFPLVVHGRAVGALNLYARRPGFFDLHEVALLERVAGSLAFALEKLIDEEQRRRDEQVRCLDIERQEALLRLGEMGAASEREIVEYALEEAVRLTRSTIGYLHFVSVDQVHLQLFMWSRDVREACYAEENTHYPLEAAGVWVDCVRERRPVYHNDYQHLESRKGYPEGHIHLVRHLSVPLIDGEKVVAVAGVGNKAEDYDETDARQLLLFMGGMWALLQRKRAEGALKAERARLEARVAERTHELQRERDRTGAILDSLGEAVMVFDMAGQIEYMNPAAVALAGDNPDGKDAVRRWWDEQRLSSDGALARMRAAAKMAQPWQGELVLERGDGMPYEAAVTVAPLFDHDMANRPIGFVSVHRDITATKAAERMKDQFVSNVSHELRSPTSLITMLAGNLEMLYERLDDARRLEVVGEIRKHARALSELIGDVLEISRIDGGRLASERCALNLAPLVHDEARHLAPVAGRKSLELAVDVADALPVVGQAGQIQQVLLNLLTNAIKYTPDGGRVLCTGRVLTGGKAAPGRDCDWPGLSRLAPGPWAAVRVTDSGIGIGQADLPHIFERFYRARTQGDIPGTGLGLSIAAELIRRHGGAIEVCSVVGEGSTFAVYLPLAAEEL
ncbi:MAG: GAF domain-containing protein, partial [Chloroflexales bacterium]|nr:GAF domain-containing protein [Chloroflexales bacterium]